MELLAADLASALRQEYGLPQEARALSWWRRGSRVALEVAAGLMFLHEQRVLHLDLKPQ